MCGPGGSIIRSQVAPKFPLNPEYTISNSYRCIICQRLPPRTALRVKVRHLADADNAVALAALVAVIVARQDTDVSL
jgi:hypothetical protein